MKQEFWKVGEQIKQCARFLQNNSDDIPFECIEECPNLKNIEIKLLVDSNSHRIMFKYNGNHNEETWFEVKE